MDLHLSGNMAAFGCSNGQIALVTINLIDQKLKLIHVFITSNKKEGEENEEEENKNCSVECIKFFPGNFPWLAGGMANGKLIIFNWEHLTGRYEFFNEDEAVIDCFWNINSVNASSISLSSICVDGTIRSWDAKNGHLIGKIDGGGDQIYSAIKLKNNVDDGIERILTGCEGGLIRIFELSF
uniref:Uncharacterized protein n=1 Tax=Meloidogyne incognita TaxID=6306 RepID=A0A914LPU4_MELIC